MSMKYPELKLRQLPPNTKQVENPDEYQDHIARLKQAGFELYGALNGTCEETQQYARLTFERLKKEGWECVITVSDKTVSIWQRDPNALPPIIKELIKSKILKQVESK